VPEPQMCATVMPDSDLIAVVESALAGDALHGLQGEQYDVMLRVGGEGADPDQDLYASKALQIAARIPPDRTPNQNPFLDEIDASTSASADGFVLPLGRCVDQASPIVVPPDTTVHIMPVEPPGIHEVYTIPTLDGQLDTFTESITYQWTAGAGSFSTGMTGGARDIFGNMPPIGNDWTSPSAHDLKGETMDVPIWIVQRDERLGAAWFESCLRVAP
ncbi:MAG TPA: hypothetical protein VLX92_33720, partial [Kofleriaceae bacterium]|nr:hypothetical protein [Kofleriaceae bacterium]